MMVAASTAVLCVIKGPMAILFPIGYWLYTSNPLGLWLFRYTHPELATEAPRAPCAERAAVVLGKGVRVEIVPVLNDNYCYVVVDVAAGAGVLVDPAHGRYAARILDELGLACAGILTTHHHWDHAGGNADVVAALAPAAPPVYAGEPAVGRTHRAVPGQRIALTPGFTVDVISVPCHTTGHVAYHIVPTAGDSAPSAVFTGDVLFAGGVGHFFEGSAAVASECSLLPSNDRTLFSSGRREGCVRNLIGTKTGTKPDPKWDQKVVPKQDHFWSPNDLGISKFTGDRGAHPQPFWVPKVSQKWSRNWTQNWTQNWIQFGSN